MKILMTKVMSFMTIISLLLPNLAFANTTASADTEFNIVETQTIEVTEDAQVSDLVVKLNSRLERNLNKLNRKFNRISERRAQRIWNRIAKRVDYDALVRMEEMDLGQKSAKEKLIAFTNAEKITQYKAQIAQVVTTNCDSTDSARSCLSKLRDYHAQTAQLSTEKNNSDRAPASIRTFLCKVGQVGIGILFILSGVVLAPFTVGISAPLIFVGLMYAIIMPQQC
jgi:hypothetical protein